MPKDTFGKPTDLFWMDKLMLEFFLNYHILTCSYAVSTGETYTDSVLHTEVAIIITCIDETENFLRLVRLRKKALVNPVILLLNLSLNTSFSKTPILFP